jgi:hypothetical protein
MITPLTQKVVLIVWAVESPVVGRTRRNPNAGRSVASEKTDRLAGQIFPARHEWSKWKDLGVVRNSASNHDMTQFERNFISC